MADIRFLVEDIYNQDDDQDDEGYEVDQEDSSILDQVTPEELLNPIVKMERYMQSDIIVNRQMAASFSQDALRASKTREEVYHVLRLMVRLSDDVEPGVRVELMEQVPHVAVYCYEHHSMIEAISQYILYIVLRFLTDPNNQVRKTSQAALLVLLEQEVVEREDVDEQVCPVLLQLTDRESSDDYRSEAVALMSKMAPLVGRGITERHFLQRFETLCCDPLFHVRKVCASNFGEMCSVLGPELTSEKMLASFYRLCQDGVWGVRKACAECFMSISTASPFEVRKNDLADCFINLLCDKSRWVQMAAYQSLGPFISTFAEPSESGFCVGEDGTLREFLPKREPEVQSSPVRTEGQPTTSESTDASAQEKNNTAKEPQDSGTSQQERHPSPEARTTDSGYISPPELFIDTDKHDKTAPEKTAPEKPESENCPKDSGNCELTTDLDDEVDDKYFNSFLFWRTPLPQVELDEDDPEKTKSPSQKPSLGDSVEETSCSNQAQGYQEGSHNPKLGFCHGDDDSDEEEAIPLYSLTDNLDGPHSDRHLNSFHDYHDQYRFELHGPSSFEEDLLISDPHTAPPQQHIFPQALLDHYVSMTEPAKAQTIDTEIARHCAFSFPAVALTLRHDNWPCLRDTYELLASDMQWKVRRTLAFSIHELALILGEDITRRELVPIFNSFLKDLDEVRIGVLKHLADFIKLLSVVMRKEYLELFRDFLTTDNNRNWRFRFELAEQLMLLSDLYSPIQVLQHLCPIATTLATDRVADVRTVTYKLIGILLNRLHSYMDDGPARKFVSDITSKLATSPLWMRRQAFAQLCQSLLDEKMESGAQFCKEFLPSLLKLRDDNVPNVRLSLARTLTQSLLTTEYFSDEACQERDAVMSTLASLQRDPDKDVRYYSGAPEELEYTYGLEVVHESEDETQLLDPSNLEGSAEVELDSLQSAVETERHVGTSDDEVNNPVKDESVLMNNTLHNDTGAIHMNSISDESSTSERCDGIIDTFDSKEENETAERLLNAKVTEISKQAAASESPNDVSHISGGMSNEETVASLE